MPAAAPLPTYQRQYTGQRYPRQFEQQAAIQARNYRYQPRDEVSRRHFQERRAMAPAAQPQRQQRVQQQQQRQQARAQQQRPARAQQQQQRAKQQQQARPQQQQQRAQRQQLAERSQRGQDRREDKGRNKED